MPKRIATPVMAATAAGILVMAAAPAQALPAFDAPVAQHVNTGAAQVANHGGQGRWADRGYYGGDSYQGRRAAYAEPVYANTPVWRGRDGRNYCRKSDGTVGLIVGGAAGALIGRELDRGYDRTLGTILGAAGGALLGRAVDRGGSSCR